MKIIPRETRQGMIQVTKNMLFTFHDIQEVCIKLGYDNQKMLDELTGFPNGKDKCIGVLDLENKENIWYTQMYSMVKCQTLLSH